MIDHRSGPFAPDVSPEAARVRRALISLALGRGIPALTPASICEAAEVEADFFDGRFEDVSDCCLQVYIANIAEFDRLVFGAVDEVDGWPARLRTAAWQATRYLRDRPLESRFNFIEMLEGGDEAIVYRDRYVMRIVELIDEGRRRMEDPDQHGIELAQAAFGSIYEFLARKFQQGEDGTTMERYVPELMFIAVQPYVGADEARRELEIPPPPERER